MPLLYHGTTEAAAARILEEGLEGPSYWGTREVAESYAAGALIAVDSDRLQAGLEPNVLLADSMLESAPDDPDVAEWASSPMGWEDSLRIFGSVLCEDRVHVDPDDFVSGAPGPRHAR